MYEQSNRMFRKFVIKEWTDHAETIGICFRNTKIYSKNRRNIYEEGILSEDQIIEVLEFQFGIPHIDLNKYLIDPEIPRLINEN